MSLSHPYRDSLFLAAPLSLSPSLPLSPSFVSLVEHSVLSQPASHERHSSGMVTLVPRR